VRSHACTALALLAVSLGAVARAAPADDPHKVADLPVEGSITNPDWISKPTADQLSNVFPIAAQALNISGRAEINCAVNAQGDAVDCTVVEETPLGQGFGRAALKLTPFFKMKPQMIDGVPMGGARVNIPIRFQLANASAGPTAPSPTIASPSPVAVDFARRIVAASGDTPAVPAQMAGWIASVQRLSEAQTTDPENARRLRAALDAVQSSLAQAQPEFRDARAHAIAHMFDEAELAQIAAFFESPAGRAWAARLQAVDALEAQETFGVIQAARAAAQERYCESGHCASSTPTPSTPR
jgi:TonB family protein